MNHLSQLAAKFANEINLYGITSVTVKCGRIYVESAIKIPYELFNSFECELL